MKERSKGVAKEVVWLDVNDLEVDAMNMRGGEEGYDEEFVQDVKVNGVRTPLVVRANTREASGKYGIVCGGRRYNAAIKAGLSRVPCFIEEMDDATAIGSSIAENKHRKDIPAWHYALKLLEMWELIGGKRADRVKVIKDKTGFADSTISSYLAIASLPPNVIELMKDPSERSEAVAKKVARAREEAEKTGHKIFVTKKDVLSYDKAAEIGRILKHRRDAMFGTAVRVMPLPREAAFKVIEGECQLSVLTPEQVKEMWEEGALQREIDRLNKMAVKLCLKLEVFKDKDIGELEHLNVALTGLRSVINEILNKIKEANEAKRKAKKVADSSG